MKIGIVRKHSSIENTNNEKAIFLGVAAGEKKTNLEVIP